ncbi:MAG: ABC transporter permease subunit [Proteobacteria bacterium]|nr:ABC transporter permease subunit [Pseudomonadota bacterium]
MLPTLILVVGLVFMLIHMVPGDPVDALLGDRATPTDREALRVALGLNLPLGEQFVNYVSGLAVGDWGVSLVSGRPVLQVLLERAPATAWLALWAMVVAICSGALLGVAGIWGRALWGKSKLLSRLVNLATLVVMATPTFVLGPLLIVVVAIGLGWVPVSGNEGWESVILPALTLGAGLGAVLARMITASLRGELRADYVRLVAAKGGSRRRRLGHALRNALLPVVQLFFLQVGMVLTGAVLTEAVFGWPGLGNLLVESLHQRDYPMMQGCLLLISLVYMVSLLLADMLSAWLDPRVGN